MLGLGKKAKTETLTGGAAIARLLANEGAERVFGIIDGTYHGLTKSLAPAGIELVSPRHESCGTWMAGAYARLTGKLGVCIASNGPGVANVLPGVAVENAEGNRVMLITSCRRTGIAYPDRGGTFQNFSQTGVIGAMSKFSENVPSADRLPEVFRRAFRAAFSGRPGIVHVDIPEDVINGPIELPAGWDRLPETYRRVDAPAASANDVERAARILLDAKRPMIHAGSGVLHANATAELDAIARLLHAPVTTSWGARAAVSELAGYAVPLTHLELCNRVRNEADAVLALGTRLGETDWWGKAPYWAKPEDQRFIQVDLEEAAIGVNRGVDVGSVACVKSFLAQLGEVIAERKAEIDVAGRRAWLEEIADRKSRDRTKLAKKHLGKAKPGALVPPAAIPSICRERFSDESVCVLDGGNTAVWGHFFYETRRPGMLLSTFKMGMLGAGVAQANGAAIARPGKPVCALIGDGAMAMQIQEVETAVRENLHVVFIVVCDRQWGMVKMGQQFANRPIKTLIKGTLSPDENLNTDFHQTAFDEIAKAMGAHGERCQTTEELDAALRRAIERGGPTVVQVEVDRVAHLWAPGLREFKDMHQEPSGA